MKKEFSCQQVIPVAPWIVLDGPVPIRIRRAFKPAQATPSFKSAFNQSVRRNKKNAAVHALNAWVFDALIGN
jgi:hypothetical protein